MFFDLAPTPAVKPRPQRTLLPDMRNYVNGRATDYGYTGDVIRGPARRRDIVDVRAVIATELREFGYSYPAIGHAMNRDHSSIFYLVNDYRKGPRKAARYLRQLERAG